LHPYLLEAGRLQDAITSYGHSARVVFQASRNDEEREEIDDLITRVLADIDDPVQALSDFGKGASVVESHMIFQINPEDDDQRTAFVSFTSSSIYRKLLTSIKLQLVERSDKIKQFKNLIRDGRAVSEYPG
jgi:hypothetical protein